MPGCPSIELSADTVKEWRSLNFSWTKIASLIGVSRSTLYRRLKDFGIETDDYTAVQTADLDHEIKGIKQDHPNDGEVIMKGHLLSKGIKVKRKDLRESIHRVDHDNTVKRRSIAIKRRTYTVPHPNAMWHCDSHHKLIRWRFITHAAIDGFSRLIVYILCANNNKSETVLTAFEDGVSRFGLPCHVRTDHGGENIKVWEYMLTAHNNDVTSVITGSSTHNERIERLWRDVQRSVGSVFSSVFRTLEDEGILSYINEVDMFVLHYVFLPRINRNLNAFQESWNSHSLSTEGNRTPYQLFVEGIVLVQDELTSATLPPCPIPRQSQSTASNTSATAVEVPLNTFRACPVLTAALDSVDPLQTCSDQGASLYRSAIQIAGNHLASNCPLCIFA